VLIPINLISKYLDHITVEDKNGLSREEHFKPQMIFLLFDPAEFAKDIFYFVNDNLVPNLVVHCALEGFEQMSQPFIIHQGAVKQKKKLNNFMYWELVAT
jgi:hypothetical protein